MIGMMVNFAVMGIVTMFTKPPPKEIQDMVGTLRYPKESDHAKA